MESNRGLVYHHMKCYWRRWPWYRCRARRAHFALLRSASERSELSVIPLPDSSNWRSEECRYCHYLVYPDVPKGTRMQCGMAAPQSIISLKRDDQAPRSLVRKSADQTFLSVLGSRQPWGLGVI